MSRSSDLQVRSCRPLCRDDALATLRRREAELRLLGVQRLFLFGSTARNEAGIDSDIDLFFDYEAGRFGLFELMDVKERVSEILGRKADIMTRDSLHKTLRRRIEATAIPVF
jgi:predicted nucleotidyltransferase